MTLALSDSRVGALREQGFVVAPDVLTSEEVSAALGEAERLQERAATLARSEGGFNLESVGGGFRGRDGSIEGMRGVLRKVQEVAEHSEHFRRLAGDSRFAELVSPILGAEPRLTTSVLWFKPAHSGSPKPWHQDAPYLDPRSRDQISVWIALDPATASNGCLRFVPGSHRRGHVPHVGEEPHVELGHDDEAAAALCELTPGSAVLFSSWTLHASGANTSPRARRALLLRYAPAR